MSNYDLFNSIPFNTYLKPDATPYAALLEHLCAQLKSLPRFKYWQKIHDQHLLLVLQNLHLAYLMSPYTFVAYSRDRNSYAMRVQKAPPIKVSFNATRKIVDGFYELNLLEGSNGIHYDNVAHRARMRAMPILGNLFPVTEEDPLVLVPLERDLIVLKDEKKVKVQFSERKETQRMRENVQTINSVNQKHFIALCISDEEYRRVLKRINKKKFGGWTTTDMYFGKTGIYRSFSNNTFFEGGRFVGGWWENIPNKSPKNAPRDYQREYRKFIRINNRTTVELDYSCLHPTLLYLEDDLPVPKGDMYEVPGFPSEVRDLLKKCMNTMINSKSRFAARKSIQHRLNLGDPDYPPLPEGMSLDQIIDGFLEKHHAIEKHFFTAKWGKLQRIESDIAESVMLKLVHKNIAVLPIHDSFLVSRIHKDDLATAMNEAVSEKYWNTIKIKPDGTLWDFIMDEVYAAGIEEDFGNIEAYEREAIRDSEGIYREYNRQCRLFKERGGKL